MIAIVKIFFEGEEDFEYEDIYCCYDPRYQGPKNYCHCAEYSKAMEREMHWFYGRWDRFTNWMSRKIMAVKRGIKKLQSIKRESNNSDDLPF